MRYLEVRRHSIREKPNEHLSDDGVRLARRVGETMMTFERVYTSPLPRAQETALAMGYAIHDTVKALGTDPLAKVDSHVDWKAGFAGWKSAYARSKAVAKFARRQEKLFRELVLTVPDGSNVLLVTHEGVPEIGAIACVPDADHAAFGANCGFCEGVRLTYYGQDFVRVEVLRVDNQKNDVVSTGEGMDTTTPHILATDFEFPEGPAFDRAGSLYVVNHQSLTGRIHRIAPDGSVTTFVETGGKPNGSAFHENGDLYVADAGTRSILRVTPGGEIHTVVDAFNGERLNAPNDLVFDRNGNLYFTDPARFPRPDLCLSPVYRLNVDGRLERLIEDLAFPNGIALSPNERTLYVAETRRHQTTAFAIRSDGSIGKSRVLARYEPPARPDGMAIDEDGNLIVALIHGSRLAVIAPDGEMLDEYPAGGTGPTNVCFGGDDFRHLYVTETETNAVVVIAHTRRGWRLFGDRR
jgi:gluconolactonase